MKKYDSVAEENVANNLILSLGYRRVEEQEYIKVPLIDADGTSFNAKLDFIPLNANNLTIEFKTTGMNSKGTKKIASKSLEKAMSAFHDFETGKTISYVNQCNAWSNSAYKHAEQSAKLAPLSHVVVFSSWPTYENIKLYLSLGILFCHTSGLADLNSYCEMARNGLNISFKWQTPDGQQLVFPLLAMYQHQLENYIARDIDKPATNIAWKYQIAPKKQWQAAGFESALQKKKRLKR